MVLVSLVFKYNVDFHTAVFPYCKLKIKKTAHESK